MNLVHCVVDDKFIDGMIDVFDTFTKDQVHHYIYLNDNITYKFRYIKKSDRISIVRYSSFIGFLDQHKVNAILLHSISSIRLSILPIVDKKIKIVWLAWGYDIYTYPTFGHPLVKIKNYYKPKTLKLIRNFSSWKIRMKQEVYYYLHLRGLKKSIRRIDYFSGVLPIEYSFLTHWNFFKAEQVFFNYTSLNNRICEENINDPIVKGNDILIGNSADPSNNHLDVFEKLSDINISGMQLYVPLSYGGNARYITVVKNQGKEHFNHSFVPLENFLPLEEYSRIVSSCSNVIMYHERQQAMGNIFMALWNGCKVFLSETSVTYKYLKSCGYHVFSLDRDKNLLSKSTMFETDFVMENRKIMIDDVSLQCQIRKIKRLLEKIKNDA